MKGDFLLSLAEAQDLESIAGIMEEAASDREHPDWFQSDNAEYIRDHLAGKGFVAVAKSPQGKVAGFFIIKFGDGATDELGDLLGFSTEQKKHTAVMDSAVVKKEFRGHGLQRAMLAFCEKQLENRDFRYYICTVHPKNSYSLTNMQDGGFEVAKKVLCYGGKERLLLVKKVYQIGYLPVKQAVHKGSSPIIDLKSPMDK